MNAMQIQLQLQLNKLVGGTEALGENLPQWHFDFLDLLSSYSIGFSRPSVLLISYVQDEECQCFPIVTVCSVVCSSPSDILPQIQTEKTFTVTLRSLVHTAHNSKF
jgi:hypothetical protein